MEIEKVIELLREVKGELWPELIEAARISASMVFGFGLFFLLAGIVACLLMWKFKNDYGPFWFLAVFSLLLGFGLLLNSYYLFSTLEYQAYKLLIGQ